MMRPSRRHVLAMGGAAAASVGLIGSARAQVAPENRIYVGTVFPSRTGLSTVRSSINDYPGEGGRMGTILAETVIGREAESEGLFLDVLLASSPSAESARRAAERLVEANEVDFLVGGIGVGQAEALSQVAEAAQIPFFNVGSSRDALRKGDCGRYTFHIEASDAMYLDAIAMLGAEQGKRRWFIVYEDNEDGMAKQQRAIRAIARYGNGAEVVGGAAVQDEQPVYINEANAIGRSNADVVLLALNAVDEIAFLNQMETLGSETAVLTLPTYLTQTRDFTATIRFLAAVNNPRETLSLWETTYQDNGAADFNERFLSRWSETVDPTAWASYQAVKIALEVRKAIGTLSGPEVVEYLESPEAVFDVFKGPGTSFRPWDHQLRQPLNVVAVDQEIEWVRTELQTRVGIASYSRELPAPDAAADPTTRLDMLGDGPDETSCTF